MGKTRGHLRRKNLREKDKKEKMRKIGCQWGWPTRYLFKTKNQGCKEKKLQKNDLPCQGRWWANTLSLILPIFTTMIMPKCTTIFSSLETHSFWNNDQQKQHTNTIFSLKNVIQLWFWLSCSFEFCESKLYMAVNFSNVTSDKCSLKLSASQALGHSVRPTALASIQDRAVVTLW